MVRGLHSKGIILKIRIAAPWDASARLARSVGGGDVARRLHPAPILGGPVTSAVKLRAVCRGINLESVWFAQKYEMQ